MRAKQCSGSVLTDIAAAKDTENVTGDYSTAGLIAAGGDL